MKWTPSLCTAALLFFSCSNPATPVEETEAGLDAGQDAGTGTDILLRHDALDLASGSDTYEVTFVDHFSDLAEETTSLECAPGEGCFLSPCLENGDCQSGWCVEHMGEQVCTKSCSEECPPGWVCQQLTDRAPDLVFVCASQFANLCRPCVAAADCSGSAGTEAVCVDYGTEGSFCGGTCVSSEDCPWGFACQEAASVDGITTMQCVAEAGVCPCTKTAVALGLWTSCEISNSWGTCVGKRVCTADGLTDCDALEPAAEDCNGMDDNCDGDVDEAVFLEGNYIGLCDDGSDCSNDACKGVDGCSHEPLDVGECVDDDPCTVGDHCEEGACVGSPVVCDDSNPCTDDSCDGLGGCQFEPNYAECDDSIPCTVGDHCNAGACSGTQVSCECNDDADCDPLEDDDLCNGTLVCDTGKIPHQCEVDPLTVVVCPPPLDPEDLCTAVTCNPDNGFCSEGAANTGFACDDEDACTIGDTCENGQCVPGVPANCADDTPCTDDWCDAANGCQHDVNSAPCNDGDGCTLGDQCQDGQCVSGAPVDCNDGNTCTADSCDASSGCVHTPAAGPCSDNNLCTGGDHCEAGACHYDSLLECDDDNICTTDGCDPENGCVHGLNSAPCDDDNPCTTGDYCSLGQCVFAGSLSCDDGNSCTADSCDASSGCVHNAADGPCSDDNLCTDGDHCEAGSCHYDSLVDCDDDNTCTNNGCDPVSGCVHTLNAAPCNDDNLCTTGDHCSLGQCVSGGSLSCQDSNICTDDLCSAQVGCQFVHNQAACDDGNACTAGDLCSGGKCTGQDEVQCDDENSCTLDTCESAKGCAHFPLEGLCDDGDACTEADACNAGVCVGADVQCDDGNFCTKDLCDTDEGCLYANIDQGCDDGDACTDNDLCANGECAGIVLDCDDANICTDDSCDSNSGCLNVNNSEPCPDGKCVNGECKDVACVPATGNLSVGQVPEMYGFCWYLSQPHGYCDATCAEVGGSNLAVQAENSWPDHCGAAEADDVSTWFYENGNPGGWVGVGGGTNGHTLGYGYQNAHYYGKCKVGGHDPIGTYPGTINDSNSRMVVCPCFAL